MGAITCWRYTGPVIATVCAVVVSAGSAHAQAAPDLAGQPRISALQIAGGCCHDYPAQAAIVMRLLQNELPLDWTFQYLNWRANRETPAFYSDPNWFQGYDIVVHNDCFTPPDELLSDDYLSSAAAAHRAGIPAVVIHCAMHTFRDASSDQWRSLLGVESRRHGPQQNIAVQILEPDHPIVDGIQGWVTPMDELYLVERVFPGVVPLMSAVDPADGREHVIAWVHENNGARVFGTTLGHGMATWDDPIFQRLITQGFRWALQQ